MAALQLNRSQLYEMLKSELPLLIDFWAPWCVDCRRISGVYDRIAEENEGKLIVAKINIDDEALWEEEKINRIPTLRIYENGKILGSIEEPGSKAAIDTFIRNTLSR